MSTRRGCRPLVLLVAIGLVASCSGGGGGSASAEERYGLPVPRNGSITYQPDVVVINGGPSAIKSASSDGISATISSGALDGVEVGKIVFVSGRVVGRVLAMAPGDGGTKLTLGPVALTDLIQDGSINYEGPVDVADMAFHVAPDFPSSVESHPLAGTSDASSSPAPADSSSSPEQSLGRVEPQLQLVAASYPHQTPPAPTAPTLPPLPTAPSIPPIPTVPPALATGSLPVPTNVPVLDQTIGPFNVQSTKSDSVLGVHVGYSANGTTVSAQMDLRIGAPRVVFHVDIGKGSLLKVEAALYGAAGLHMEFNATTTTGLNGNTHRVIPLPVDLSIPIGGPIPVSLTFRQSFSIDTVFSAKNTTLRAVGDYSFSGAIGMQFDSAKGFHLFAPAQFTVNESLLESTDGVSIGVNGLVLAYGLRAMLGIGAFGFAIGPFVSISASVAVTNGSNLGIVKCKGATLTVVVGAGVGYQIPKPIADLVNGLLSILNVKHIESSGGPQTKRQIVNISAYTPKKQICAGAV